MKLAVKENKAKNLSKSIITIGVISYIALILFFSYSQYLANINLSRKLVLDKLNAIAMSLCAQVDIGDMQYIINSYENKDDIKQNLDDIVYLSLHRLFKEVEEKNKQESPIYTTVFNENKEVF